MIYKTLERVKLAYFSLDQNNIKYLLNKNIREIIFYYCGWYDRYNSWNFIHNNLDIIKDTYLSIYDELKFCNEDELEIIDKIIKDKENLTIDIDDYRREMKYETN